MYNVFIQTALLILLGVLWRRFTPQGLDADTLRHSLTTLVYTAARSSSVSSSTRAVPR